ncbi:hypothetical protein SHIRM173S_08888 [Streptomyces hirsutus]
MPVSTCTRRSPAPTAALEFDQVVATPHLGASADEAEKAGIAVARSVRLALAGELVPDAVNVQGGVIAEDVEATPLAERLGRIFTALAGEVAVRLDVEVYGEITQHDVKVLELSAPQGCLRGRHDDGVVRRRPAAPRRSAVSRCG